MKAVISRNIRIYDCTPEFRAWIEENLIITNPIWATLMRLGKKDDIARRNVPEKMKLFVEMGFGQDYILPFGILYAVWPFIKDNYSLLFNDNGQVIDQNMQISTPLYDYQEEAVKKMMAIKGGVLQASAGAGKTQIGIELIKRLGKNALWLCGKTDLLNQTVSRIHSLYPELPVGTITDGEIKLVKNGITVSTVQTLVNVDREVYSNIFDTIVVDECHACVSTPTNLKMFGKVVEGIAARYKFGLTATPSRSDTMIKCMYTILGCTPTGKFEPIHIIEKDKTNTLTAKHIKFELDTPFSYDSLDESGMLDYKGMIDFLCLNEERNQTIVNNVIKVMDKHKKQLVLCLRKEQCEIINKMLQEKGVNSVLLTGDVTKAKRKNILNSVIDWNVIVGTVSLVKEGLDVPELSCLHWATVIGDQVATIQSAGRIERVCDGKPEPEIYDYVDMNYPYCIGKWKKRIAFLRKR